MEVLVGIDSPRLGGPHPFDRALRVDVDAEADHEFGA
jgi:hypothetical protein